MSSEVTTPFISILVMFHSDDLRWYGPSNTVRMGRISFKYKVKDCTENGINVTTDKEGNYYLAQNKAVEGVVKAAKLSGAKI